MEKGQLGYKKHEHESLISFHTKTKIINGSILTGKYAHTVKKKTSVNQLQAQKEDRAAPE